MGGRLGFFLNIAKILYFDICLDLLIIIYVNLVDWHQRQLNTLVFCKVSIAHQLISVHASLL